MGNNSRIPKSKVNLPPLSLNHSILPYQKYVGKLNHLELRLFWYNYLLVRLYVEGFGERPARIFFQKLRITTLFCYFNFSPKPSIYPLFGVQFSNLQLFKIAYIEAFICSRFSGVALRMSSKLLRGFSVYPITFS
jgi:hypothetical protein